MSEYETFIQGIHSRPFSKELNAYNGTLGVEWDYGGQLTKAIYAVDQWPVKFADLSYWQDNVDFAKLATMVQGVIIRAVFGNKDIDPRFEEYYKKAKDNKLEVMLYHYLKPSASWQKHAETIIAVEKSHPSLEIWGDLEEDGGLNKQDLEGWLFKYFMNNVVKYKEKTGCYSSKGFLDKSLNKTNWLKTLDLWLAAWTTASQPAMPVEYAEINNPKTWKLWQWTSKGDGFAHGVSSRYIDLNRYNGSIEQFNKEYNTNIKPISGTIPPPPPIEPPPSVFPKQILTTATALNVRLSPSTTGKIIGSVPLGTEFTAIDYSEIDPNWLEVIVNIHKGYVKDK